MVTQTNGNFLAILQSEFKTNAEEIICQFGLGILSESPHQWTLFLIVAVLPILRV
jgi:hypothetical protein